MKSLFQDIEQANFERAADERLAGRQPVERNPREHDPRDPFDIEGDDLSWQQGGGKSGGYGEIKGLKGKGSPFNARERYDGAVKALQAVHPGFYWACDCKGVVTKDGAFALIDRDALGFLDIIGVSGGRLIGCNVTTRDQIRPHLSKWTNASNFYKGKVFGSNSKKVVDLLLKFLSEGGRMYLLGAHKPGRFWEFEVFEVTAEVVAETIGRKRK